MRGWRLEAMLRIAIACSDLEYPITSGSQDETASP